jgi:hypothetical protein
MIKHLLPHFFVLRHLVTAIHASDESHRSFIKEQGFFVEQEGLVFFGWFRCNCGFGVGLRLLIGLTLLATRRHQNKCRRCEYKEQVFYTLFPDTKRIDIERCCHYFSAIGQRLNSFD